MPMLHTCGHEGCETLTLGGLCIAHEPVQEARTFPRGRPYPPLAPQRARIVARFLPDDSLSEEQAEVVRGFA